jgi:hypothetical protein
VTLAGGIAVALIALWVVGLLVIVTTRRALLRATWREPYVDEPVVILESDDWGPGPPDHTEALRRLLQVLAAHRDGVGRPAVLTANMVLSVPDGPAIVAGGFRGYARRELDVDFPELFTVMREGRAAGTFFPQLHGREHLNPEALLRRARNGDLSLRRLLEIPGWSDWESLDSPLQGHFVDGSELPTRPVAMDQQRSMVAEGVLLFARAFGESPASAVAPCYLWNDDTEAAWAAAGVRYIQTAGYRCIGRGMDGAYIQSPRWLHAGSTNRQGQRYLVRNVMYEPADGRDWEAAWREVRHRFREAQPAVISTHRYNYTRTEIRAQALRGLDELLDRVCRRYPRVRFAASPEWGRWLDRGELADALTHGTWPTPRSASGPRRIAGFLRRLWRRHEKLRWLVAATGLIVPGVLLVILLDGVAALAGRWAVVAVGETGALHG